MAPAGEPFVGESRSAAELEATVVAAKVSEHRSAGRVAAETAAVIQRQPDAGAPEPADLLIPTDVGWSPSTPGIFSIEVDSSGGRPAGAHGSASSRGVFLFSAMGRLEHFCSTPASYPLQIRFYLDAAGRPRPQPFRAPSLSVVADFTPTGGAPRRVANGTDAAPGYAGPGWPLVPAFGELVSARSSQSGSLNVTATMADPDTATTITYRDTVACELVPCA